MKEQFVSYEIALKLKELGFDEKCLASYYTDDERNYAKDGTYDCRQKISSSIDFDPFKEEFDNFYINSNETYYVSAPLWGQVIDWFRDKYNLVSEIFHNPEYEWKNWKYRFYWTTERLRLSNISDGHYETYEEAELACIKKLIEIAKEQNVK